MPNRLVPTLVLLSLCGCWFRLGNATGSMLLTWTLNGGEDCATAGITEVQVAGGGVSITLPCTDVQEGSVAGASLPHVAAGNQTFTLTGLGQVYDADAGIDRPQAAFRGAFSFDVAEESTNIAPVVDLAPVDPNGQEGDLLLLWSFAGQTCAQAQVDQVTIVLDGFAQLLDGGFAAQGNSITLPCSSDGLDGVRFLGLAQNLYAYPISAHGPANTPAALYVAAPTAYVTGFTESIEHVDLHLARDEALVGDAITSELFFNFGPDGGGCTQSQVDEIRIQLFQSNVSGGLVPIDGTASLINYQSLPVLDLTVPCPDTGDPSDRPSWTTSTTDQIPGRALPCNPGDFDAGISCPIVPGEYALAVQGLTAGGAVVFELDSADLWVDEGLSNGVAAGVVSEYGETRFYGPIPGVVYSMYEVNVPVAAQ